MFEPSSVAIAAASAHLSKPWDSGPISAYRSAKLRQVTAVLLAGPVMTDRPSIRDLELDVLDAGRGADVGLALGPDRARGVGDVGLARAERAKPSPVPGPSTVTLKSGFSGLEAPRRRRRRSARRWTSPRWRSSRSRPPLGGALGGRALGRGRAPSRRCSARRTARSVAAAAAAGGDEQGRGERESADALGRCDESRVTPPDGVSGAQVRRSASFSVAAACHDSDGAVNDRCPSG